MLFGSSRCTQPRPRPRPPAPRLPFALLAGRQANAKLDKAARAKRRRELEKQVRIAVDQSLCFLCLWLVVLVSVVALFATLWA